MMVPPSPTNWITVIGSHGSIFFGRVKAVRRWKDPYIKCTLVGESGSFHFCLDDEGGTWVRGKYDPNTERGQAFLAEYLIQQNA